MYDVTDFGSFNNVKTWLHEIERFAIEDVSKLLVGNKSDLESKRAVDRSTAQQLADSEGISFLETSAKNASNVEEAFLTMAGDIKRSMGTGQVLKPPQGTVVVSGEAIDNGSGCCG